MSNILCPYEPDHLDQKWFDKAYANKIAIGYAVKPRTVAEIGVRAGYGAWALAAYTDELLEEYFGVDNDTERRFRPGTPRHFSFLQWAEKVTLHQSYEKHHIEKCDSMWLKTLPVQNFDIYHVDAVHSFEGVQHELRLCYESSREDSVIVVDDYNDSPSSRLIVEGVLKWLEEVDHDMFVGVMAGLTGELLMTRYLDTFTSSLLEIKGFHIGTKPLPMVR